MNQDTQLMEIDEQEKFLKDFQAIYYAMNAKPDCKSKIFPKNINVEFADINELNRRITEKFKAHYDDAGFMINITVSFKDHTAIEFNSWTTFEKHNFDITVPIEGITLVWEYNAKLPKYSVPQKHTLTVRLSDRLRPQDMINLVFSGKLSEMDFIEQEFCPTIARIDFINSILGDELLAIVSDWVESVSTVNGKNRVIKFLEKNKRKVAYTINYFTVLVAIVSCLIYLKGYLFKLKLNTLGEMTIPLFYELLVLLIVLGLICFVVYKVFFIVANIVFKTLDEMEDEYHTFDITKGDKKMQKTISLHRKKNLLKVIGNIIFTLLFEIFCAIMSNMLS